MINFYFSDEYANHDTGSHPESIQRIKTEFPKRPSKPRFSLFEIEKLERQKHYQHKIEICLHLLKIGTIKV